MKNSGYVVVALKIARQSWKLEGSCLAVREQLVRHARRQRLERLETERRGQVIGELHRREGVSEGSSVPARLCRFSIDEQGVDAVSRKKWGFKKEKERAKFLEDVGRRGPPVLWVRCPCQKSDMFQY